MTSTNTHSSLRLQPMNSENYTAALEGISSSDTDKQTNSNKDNPNEQQKIQNMATTTTTLTVTPHQQYVRNNQMKIGISEEDIIPPFNSTMCSTNSLINNSSVILANNNNNDNNNAKPSSVELDLSLKPQSKHHVQNNNDNDANTVITPLPDIFEKSEKSDSKSLTPHTSNDLTEETTKLSKSSSQNSNVKHDDNINNTITENIPQVNSNTDSNTTIKEEDLQFKQRQLYEKKLEQKKMDQFRKLHMLDLSSENSLNGVSKSMSPMSPKSTAPLSQKLPNAPLNSSSLSLNKARSIDKSIGKPAIPIYSDKNNSSKNSSRSTSGNNIPQNILNNKGNIPLMSNIINNKNITTIATTNTTAITNLNNNSNLTNDPQLAFSPPKRTQSPFRDLSNPYLKQINDQQRPLYTPAVLRVTKNVGVVGTPQSSEIGFDVHKLPSEQRPSVSKTSSSISIRSTASSIMDYWNYMTGRNQTKSIDEPTRAHWKPDSSRFNCAQCGKIFNYLTGTRRKHHCRACGDIFCGDCLQNYIYLDKNAKFTLFGSNWDGNDGDNDDDNSNTDEENSNDKKYLCKVCLSCFQKYEEYVLDHTTRDHNLGTNGKDLKKTNTNNNNNNDANMDTQNVPLDWNWSSF